MMALTAEDVLQILRSDYPQPIWFVPSLALLLLAYASFVDARTGRVPNLPIIIGILGTICGLAWFAGWFVAGERFLLVALSVAGLKAIGEIAYKILRRDALGYGDAKWTGLAVAAFGLKSVLIGWVVAAWIGVFWIVIKSVIDRLGNHYRTEGYVHFAPFLFAGLLLSLFREAILASLL